MLFYIFSIPEDVEEYDEEEEDAQNVERWANLLQS